MRDYTLQYIEVRQGYVTSSNRMTCGKGSELSSLKRRRLHIPDGIGLVSGAAISLGS